MSPSSSVSELSSYSLTASAKAEIGTVDIFLRAAAGAPAWRLSKVIRNEFNINEAKGEYVTVRNCTPYAADAPKDRVYGYAPQMPTT
jgi:hypothetical protein